MKPEKQSIEDLHQTALADFDGDENTERVLNATYEAIRANYIAVLTILRAVVEKARRNE